MPCATCRHHSKKTRHVVLSLDTEEAQMGLDSPDGEPRFADTSDDPNGATEDVYTCQHPSRPGTTPPGTCVGPDSGAGCTLYTVDTKAAISPELAARLKRFEE